MTKKTNSILFRLGITSLWENKTPDFFLFINDTRLEKILHKELQKRKFDILDINWHLNFVEVLVYESLDFMKSFKQVVFYYYKQKKNILRVINLYSLPRSLLLRVFKDKRFHISKSISNKRSQQYIYVYFLLGYYRLKQVFKLMATTLKGFHWVRLHGLLKCLYILSIMYPFFFSKIKQINIKLDLKRIWSSNFFKTLSILLENVIFYVKQRYISIKLLSVWEKKGLIVKYFAVDFFIFQLLILASAYNNSDIISKFISLQLKKDKNHRRLIRKIVLAVDKFWTSYNFGFNGFQLRITGKLNGKMRKSKYQFILGKVSLQSIDTALNYTIAIAFTKFGVISTKLWILHGKKEIHQIS